MFNSNSTLVANLVSTDPVCKMAIETAQVMFLDDSPETNSSPVIRLITYLTKRMLNEHQRTLTVMLRDVDSRIDSIRKTVYSIANVVFEDGCVNWGRIISIYAFGLGWSRCLRAQKNEHLILELADSVGVFIGLRLNQWIVGVGGWDMLLTRMPIASRHATMICYIHRARNIFSHSLALFSGILLFLRRTK